MVIYGGSSDSFFHDEGTNSGGLSVCSSSNNNNDCDGWRVCNVNLDPTSPNTWCNGISRTYDDSPRIASCDYAGYQVSEQSNHQCTTDCDCDGFRICSNGECQGTARYGGTQYCDHEDFIWDENSNKIGSYACWSDCDCDGERTCSLVSGSTQGWCVGTARTIVTNTSECNKTSDYVYDESNGPQGPSSCDYDHCDCGGLRICTKYGWCQGTARNPQFGGTNASVTIAILQNIDNTHSKSGTDTINLSFKNEYGDQLGCNFKLSNKGVKAFQTVVLTCSTSLDVYFTADGTMISKKIPCYNGIHTVMLPFDAQNSTAATIGVDLVDYADQKIDDKYNNANPLIGIAADTITDLVSLSAKQFTGTRNSTYVMMATISNNGTSSSGIQISDANCSISDFSYGRILSVTSIVFLSFHMLVLII